MNARISFLLPLLLFVIIIFFLWRSIGKDPNLLPSKLIGQPVPTFIAPSLDGTLIEASKTFRGKVTLLNIWASWCSSCLVEHPFLIDLAKINGVQIVGLDYKDKRQAANEYLNKNGNPFTQIIYDDTGQYAMQLGVYGSPETFLIDKQGIVRYRFVGAMTFESVEKDLLPRVRQLAEEKV